MDGIDKISTVELSDGWFVNRFSAHVTFVKGLDALLTATVPTLEGHVSLSLHTDWAKHLVLDLLDVLQRDHRKYIFCKHLHFCLQHSESFLFSCLDVTLCKITTPSSSHFAFLIT